MKTEFIKNRQEIFIENFPYMKDLFDFLEKKVENSMVVPMPEHEKDVENLLKKGKLFEVSAELKEMKISSCHENSLNLYKKNKKRYKLITGYGYTKNDFMWRQHSWILDTKRNLIIETTVLRDFYFGYEVDEKYFD